MKLKFSKLLFIPIILILGYFALIAYPYFFSKITRFSSLGFLSIVEEKSEGVKKVGSYGEHLLKGERITGKPHATENNFGIVLVRFSQLSAIVKDTVRFRIREEGEGKWYYENDYKANQFQPNEYFTFGFPPIKESKGKRYIFEVESLAGTVKNGIGLSPKEPQAALVYKYTKQDLNNFDTLYSFVLKKLNYVIRNSIALLDGQVLTVLALPFVFMYFMRKNKFKASDFVKMLPNTKKTRKKVSISIVQEMKYNSLFIIRKIKSIYMIFSSTKFYLIFLNTNTKKRIVIGLLIFIFAFTYRFSASLVNLDKLFYAGLGGGGDYDQFIRAATCAIDSFCSLALHQNLLIESFILSGFYKIFGFTGGLWAYLYLMIIVSSIVATLPYFLLSKKSWIAIGGIIGSLFIATSDFLTEVALNFPPDNGSLFTFSVFFIVYLLTMHLGTIRWLLFFGFVGFFDGMFKALFLINDLVAFILFVPVFFYEKARQTGKSMFRKKNIKILFLSSLPLLVFLILYSAWEYFVYVKFSMPYFLRGLLLSRGESYVSYTSFDDGSLTGNIVSQLFYLLISAIVMIKRVIELADLQIVFLAPIFLGLLYFSFIKLPQKTKFPLVKFIASSILSIVTVGLLILIKNDYFNLHQVFAGEYIIDNWTDQTYIEIFLFAEIIILFILNFGYQALKLSLPILPYVVMLIILTKNSPFPRISTQVVAWSIILFAFLFDWILANINSYSKKKINVIEPAILILFLILYILPKASTMITQLYGGIENMQSVTKYLQWVNSQLPNNAIILAGGKSDLVTLGENISKPIIYSTLWTGAVLIRPNEIPGTSPSDFTIISELKNKDNFKINKYIILEDDIYVWRNRVEGVGDGIFTTNPDSTSALHGNDYILKVYKSNPDLKKSIYELRFKDSNKF